MANPKIRGISVDAPEFPELSDQYQVMAVPKTVIRAKQEVSFEGKGPESYFLNFLRDALE